MKSKERIYLIGMPGCGKSTLGMQLAEKLGLKFIDLDDAIEKEIGIINKNQIIEFLKQIITCVLKLI